MRFAYADPPYIGQAKRHYGNEPDFGGEVDHKALIQNLQTYDSWALSASSQSLRILLPMCPDNIRVGAWVKPFCFMRKGVSPAYGWEPVIYSGARSHGERYTVYGKSQSTPMDWVLTNPHGTRRCDQGTPVKGRKPEAFCYWLFSLMGLTPDDELHDLFPGSNGVTQAFERWIRSHWQKEAKIGTPVKYIPRERPGWEMLL